MASKINTGFGETIDVSAQSNTNTLNQIDVDFLLEKTAQKDWALPEETITLTTKITNNSSLAISDISFLDTLSSDASFVPGSVEIDSQKYENFNPITGFVLSGTLNGFGAYLEMSYKIKVSKYVEKNSITSKTTISFASEGKNFELQSNEKEIAILNNEVYLLKESSSSAVVSGDEVTYTITISNDGSFENTNLVFTDILPNEVTFVESSVKIDNEEKTTYNPSSGFSLNNLPAGGKIVVEFKVKIN